MSLLNALTVNNISKRLLNNKNIAKIADPLKFESHKFFSSYKDKEECKEKSEEDPCKKVKCKSTNKKKVEKKEEARKPKEEAKKCLYDDIECCLEKCPEANIKLDCLHYKMTDKLSKKYQQTWVDCVPVPKSPKFICLEDKQPCIPKRKSTDCAPQTACRNGGKDFELMECLKPGNTKCNKITIVGCDAAREPPTCKISLGVADCTKVKCPYPSYSECLKPKPLTSRVTECECLDLIPFCDVIRIAKRKGIKI